MTNAGLCFCGHDCARCNTYLATILDDTALRCQAGRFYGAVLGLNVSPDSLFCLGGRSGEVFAPCRSCPFAACCRRRGLARCADCPDYPCATLADYQAKYVNRCNQIQQGEASMEQAKIDRINALARKARVEGLTPEETAEQSTLRREYIEAHRTSLRVMLDNTVIERPDGSREKLSPKK